MPQVLPVNRDLSGRGVHPNLVNDGKDHHIIAAHRYQAHLANVHWIGEDDIVAEDLPVMTIMLAKVK